MRGLIAPADVKVPVRPILVGQTRPVELLSTRPPASHKTVHVSAGAHATL